MTEPKFITRLKEKWGINSNWQIFVICFVFAITGSTSIKVAAPILNFIGIHKTLNPWIYWPLRIIAIFPVYQILLIIIGTICGQFKFFWKMEQKMFGRFFGGTSNKE